MKVVKNKANFWRGFFLSLAAFLILAAGFWCVKNLTTAMPELLADSFSPANGETFISSSTNLTITFNVDPEAGAGNIYLKRLSDHSTFAAIPADSAAVTFNGPDAVINPAQDLENNQAYYIEIDADAFLNGGAGYYAGLSGADSWNFRAKDETFIYSLIKDLNQSGLRAEDEADKQLDFTAIATTTIFFNAYDGDTLKLWKTDGTGCGTAIMHDSGGHDIFNPAHLTVMDGILYFQASSTDYGYELYRSDGTESGTYIVKDLATGASSSYPVYLVATGSTLYFGTSNTDDNSGGQLWKTDGTGPGTVLVKTTETDDLGYVYDLIALGHYIYFINREETGGLYSEDLWRSDGTAVGTIKLMDTDPGIDSWAHKGMNNILYFGSSESNSVGLYRSDGTVVGTYRVSDSYPCRTESGTYTCIAGDPAVEMGGYLYFSGTDDDSNHELWRTDGTDLGTTLVKEIRAGGTASPMYLTRLGSYIYFTANNGTNGRELWRTDGTGGGTTLVKDVYSGSTSSGIKQLVNLNDKIYFWANDASARGIFSSEGTDVTTVLVKELYDIDKPASWFGSLFFWGESELHGYGYQPWISDGTTGNTALIKNIASATAGSEPSTTISAHGKTYFIADDRLWSSDGTAVGTVEIDNIHTGLNNLAVFTGDKVYYTGKDGTEGSLFKINAAGDGWEKIKTISSSTLNIYNGNVVMNGIFYFYASDGVNGAELWRTDDTADGTYMVKNINAAGGSYPAYSTVLNNKIYFSAADGVNGTELWSTDGTEVNTTLLKDIYSGASDSYPENLIAFNNGLYFAADNGTSGQELWKSDGTGGGTAIFKDIVAGANSSYSENFTVMGNYLYFLADNSGGKRDFWRTDGTLTGTKIVSANVQTAASNYAVMTLLDDELYFIVASSAAANTNFDVYSSNGTTTGTTLLHTFLDADIGSYFEEFSYFFRFNDEDYLSVGDEAGKNEVWKLGDSATSTYKLFSRNPLAVHEIYSTDLYANFIDLGDEMLFAYLDPYYGIEPYSGYFLETPTSTTATASSIGSTTAALSGEVVNLGRTAGVERGFAYATTTLPTINNNVVSEAAEAIGSYSLSVSGLATGTTYYYRAYASNKAGVGYGAEMSFITADYPSLSSSSISGIGQTTAQAEAELISEGNASSTERGFIWSAAAEPTLGSYLGKTAQSGTFGEGLFSAAISGLACETSYYLRAYAINPAGTAYGSSTSFATPTCECPAIDHASSYNAYPTCGPASCLSNYHLSGSACVADSSSGGGGGGGGSGGATANTNTVSSLTISPSQSGNLTQNFSDNNSVQVLVPQNSVNSVTTFKASEAGLTPENTPVVLSGATLVGNKAFDISAVSASGQTIFFFNHFLTITIKIPNLPSVTSNLGVYYFNEKTRNWILIPGAVFDAINKKVAFSSDHLTLFAVFRFIGIDIAPSLSASLIEAKETKPVLLTTLVFTEADNVVSRYYPVLDARAESQFSVKAAGLEGFASLSGNEKDAIIKFSTYGTPSTKILGAGERLGVIDSYLSAFGKLPTTVADFNDVIKIANGRWPGASSAEAVARAKASFKGIYLREADMSKPNDNAAVTIMAYGLRSANRNLNSEKAAIKIFKAIYRKNPTVASDWDAMRAIAYSGAKR